MNPQSSVHGPQSSVSGRVAPQPPRGVGPQTTMFICLLSLAALAGQQEKRYRLPSTDLKQQVIWGATCEVPDGPSLAFGGEDQKAEDGNPHTRIKVDGAWRAIHVELRSKATLRGVFGELLRQTNLMLVDYRSGFYEGYLSGGGVDLDKKIMRATQLSTAWLGQAEDLWDRTLPLIEAAAAKLEGYDADQARRAIDEAKKVRERLMEGEFYSAQSIKFVSSVKTMLEIASERVDAEPPPRALSPIAWDAKSKAFVIFGGDHLDYLTNDTWVFDPGKRKWFQRHPPTAPPPRANHQLKAVDGKIVLTGGYTYTSSTDYVGGQYRDHNDGEWTYDIAADTWTGGKGVAPDTRVYRTGRLHPDFYLEGPKPDPAAFKKVLEELPANTWVKTKPPHLPALNRDWGTAVIDPDRDLMLRFSGGHSAHGGTDVLQYHLSTNRWELCFPVEFPLGQLYTNTEYPEGVNFNRRPWVTGHTYQNYGYDPILKKMLFTGRRDGCFVYDPTAGDWTGRLEKPKGMVYGDCFYTLTLTPTPQGLVCWNQNGGLYRFEGKEWVEQKLTGAKLPGAVVDNSTLLYDAKRERLLFARKPYGDKVPFTGELHAVDVKTWAVSAVSPEGKEAAAAVPYLCQIRYDVEHDLLLVGGTLKPGEDGLRRTPAYDPAGNRWVSLKITGDDPNGKNGRNVSLGLMYDAKRKLFWAVDTNSQVYVLRLDPKSADLQPLKSE
ncbi:MAG TPA: kelch repeat-containing protein [Planctomycetota bacterium]|nr:kelch repeat-containing protein [Planctomycetota bacterium]